MSIITKRAIRLAVIVEAVSCVAMLYQAEPLSFWNSWAVALGWSTHVISDVLVTFFIGVHFPLVFLSSHLFGSVGFEVFNGRLVFTSPLGLLIMLIQCVLWSFIFLGLLHLEKRVKLLFRRHDA
jgi:hypothetical protein